MKFECIKGMATNDNLEVIVMQGDVVICKEVNDGEVIVEGKEGWCGEVEITLTPKQFIEHFKYIFKH